MNVVIFEEFRKFRHFDEIMRNIILTRRAGITSTNINKRLTPFNQLPQKRRLLDICRSRKIKRAQSRRAKKRYLFIEAVDPPPAGGGSIFLENFLNNISDHDNFVSFGKRKYERMF